EHQEGFVRGVVAVLTKLRDEIRGLLESGDVDEREDAAVPARAALDEYDVRERAEQCGLRLLADGEYYLVQSRDAMTLGGVLEHYVAPLELGVVAAAGVRLPGPPHILEPEHA